jgi:hypothetical protein
MRKKKYEVTLKENEKEELKRIIRNPREKIKKIIKAKVLLKMDEGRKNGDWTDEQIWQAFDLSPASVVRLRRQFVKEGYEAAISRRPYPKGGRRKFDGDGEAKLIALCCSTPPDGRASWSLRLLADRIVELGIVESISPEGLRQTLKKMNLSHG